MLFSQFRTMLLYMQLTHLTMMTPFMFWTSRRQTIALYVLLLKLIPLTQSFTHINVTICSSIITQAGYGYGYLLANQSIENFEALLNSLLPQKDLQVLKIQPNSRTWLFSFLIFWEVEHEETGYILHYLISYPHLLILTILLLS